MQISSRAVYEGTLKVSHEGIYQHVKTDKLTDGDLWQKMRGCKRYSKRYGRERRGSHPNRTSIHDRPSQIEEREECGHWEGDTISGLGAKVPPLRR